MEYSISIHSVDQTTRLFFRPFVLVYSVLLADAVLQFIYNFIYALHIVYKCHISFLDHCHRAIFWTSFDRKLFLAFVNRMVWLDFKLEQWKILTLLEMECIILNENVIDDLFLNSNDTSEAF